MKTRNISLYITVVLMAIITITACLNNKGDQAETSGTEPSAPPEGYSPFPTGFDYPLESSVIERYIKEENMAAIRKHGWNLWAGINQDGKNGLRVWQTWFSVSQAFDTTGLGEPLKFPGHGSLASIRSIGMDRADNTTIPIYNRKHNPKTKDCGPDHGRLANNGDIMIAGVIYNWDAYEHIRTKRLYLQSTLDSMLPEDSTTSTAIPQFPEGSIVLKHMYWPVKGDSGEFSALPVWDDNPQYSDVSYNGYETWVRAVAIAPYLDQTPEDSTASVKYLHGVGNYPTQTFDAAKVVSINDFYYEKINAADWAQMTETDQCIVNNAFQWAYGRDFVPGDYLVSLAMHIITKEIYDWTMQSLWWHDKPDTGKYAADKPTNIPGGPWQHYLLTTAYNMVTPLEPDGSPHIGYNPYIELVIPEKFRIVTNCQNCHARGAWPESKHFIVDPVGQPDITGAKGAFYNATRRGLIKETDTIFNGLVRTDFQWAIPDRAH